MHARLTFFIDNGVGGAFDAIIKSTTHCLRYKMDWLPVHDTTGSTLSPEYAPEIKLK